MERRRIVVTGGSGKAGRAVVSDLRSRDHDVLDVDIATSSHPDEPTRLVDLTDLGQTLEALHGADDVVHLAAIPAICAGGNDAGPLGKLEQRERFLMLVAPRSTIIQPSPVHTGITDDPEGTLERLMDQMVRL